MNEFPLTDKFEFLKVAANYLNDIDYNVVYRLINELGFINAISFKIHIGVEILRMRISEGKTFTNQSEISYPPNAKEFGRANKPNHPLFYGSFAAPGMQNPIIANTAECVQVLTNGNHSIIDDSVEFTVGVWKIEKDLPVFPMIFYEKHLLKNEMFRPLYENFINVNKSNPKIKDIMDFIAHEFAKSDIKSSNDYKIGAAFTDLIFKTFKGEIEAIIYPSVRIDGDGFNIAMTPEFVRQYLVLQKVYTLRMYFKDGLGIMEKEKEANHIQKDNTFDLIPISEPNVIKGRDWCLQELDRLKQEDSAKIIRIYPSTL